MSFNSIQTMQPTQFRGLPVQTPDITQQTPDITQQTPDITQRTSDISQQLINPLPNMLILQAKGININKIPKYDKNKDGRISLSEIEQRLGNAKKAKDVQKLMDLNNDGKVNTKDIQYF